MTNTVRCLLACTALLCIASIARSQDDPGIDQLSPRYLEQASSKADDLAEKLDDRSRKTLSRLYKEEIKLKRKLARVDSAAAEKLFNDIPSAYQKFEQNLAAKTLKPTVYEGIYVSHFDSISTGFKFLKEKINGQSPALQEKLKQGLPQFEKLQDKFNSTDKLNKLLEERKKYLKQELEKFGLSKEFHKYQKELYYYKSQLNASLEAFKDPSKAEKKILEWANKIPAFKDFFRKHSQLAQLFPTPNNFGTPESLAGLQTLVGIQQLLQDQVSRGGPDAMANVRNNLGNAQSRLEQIKDRVSRFGSAGKEMDMPDFKPNTEKSKSFLQRLEFGTNFQMARSGSFYPSTSDVGFSLGYRINPNSVAGLGSSMKIGWGKNVRNIKITGEGISLRSFLDLRVKKSFFASGGFEYNYQQPFRAMQAIQPEAWTKSGLIGISKIISTNSKLFKKTKAQVLWDFLSYSQRPVTQPIKFRIGYNF